MRCLYREDIDDRIVEPYPDWAIRTWDALIALGYTECDFEPETVSETDFS